MGRFLLVVGLLWLGLGLWPRVPHATDLEFVLGPDHREIVELRVAYVQGGRELSGASFPFPDGAPASVHHRVRLPHGRFEVRMEVRARGGGAEIHVRPLDTPADARVRFRLDSGGAS